MQYTIQKENRLRAFLTCCLLPVLLFLPACGGGSGGGASNNGVAAVAPALAPPAASCDSETQKQFVLETTQSWYLWYDEMAAVRVTDFATPDALLAALTAPLAVDSRDAGFSYLTTVTADEANFTSGAYVGFGFRFSLTNDNRFILSDVFEGSPADSAGLLRGVEVLAVETVNGLESIAELAARNASNQEIFGESVVGVARSFRVQIGDQVSDVTLTKSELSVPALARAPVLLERSGLSPVGYLNFRSFTTNATAPLNAIFAEFSNAGVTDYVIDLRYNGGGLLSVADQLLDLLGGEIAPAQQSFLLSHNSQHSDEDFGEFFSPQASSVRPLRIAFITTGATASASELIINSLAPHADVVLVGEDTLGKAVGQYAFDLVGCDTRLRLVAFEVLNGEGIGGYYTGLVDTGRFTLCPAADDVLIPFGDPQEQSLQTALAWLNGNSCTVTASAQSSSRSRSLAQDNWQLRNVVELPERHSDRVQ